MVHKNDHDLVVERQPQFSFTLQFGDCVVSTITMTTLNNDQLLIY